MPAKASMQKKPLAPSFEDGPTNAISHYLVSVGVGVFISCSEEEL